MWLGAGLVLAALAALAGARHERLVGEAEAAWAALYDRWDQENWRGLSDG